MKILVIILIIALGSFSFLIYQGSSVEPLEGRELQHVLGKRSAKNILLRRSFDKVLTRLQNVPTPVAKPQRALNMITADEAVDEVLLKVSSDRDKGLEHLRLLMFNREVPLDVKEDLLERLFESDFDRQDLKFFTREILGRPGRATPQLFRRALEIHSEPLDQMERQRLLRELLVRTGDQELRDIIRDFSQEP